MIKQRSSSSVMVAAGLAYVISVLTRSSLAVAALPAAERFHVSASALGALVVFQVMVYTAMQIPVGVLLDRFGPRILLIIGALSMTLGQLVVAHSELIQFAYLGRMLVGVGDAFTFVCMVRLIHDWNESRRAVRLQLFITNIGQAGQIFSAIPFAILLALAGWETAFSVAAAIALLSGITVLLVIRTDSPAGVQHHNGVTLAKSIKSLGENIRFSGTRMCFWIMFVSQSSGTVFALFWGVPFLIKGQGQTPAFASTMLVVQFALGVVIGLGLGWVSINHPSWRVPIFVSVGISQVLSWLVLGFLPGHAPVWLLFVVVATISTGAPVSMIAMDFSRTIIPAERRGSANGFINVGGHLATFIMMAIAGWVLDLVQSVTHESSPFSFTGFRFAMTTQVLVLIVGLVMFGTEYRKTKKVAAI